MAHSIVGRTEEIGALEEFLADTRPEPRAVLIEGEPGIGKTTLLRELLNRARERDYCILLCRPTRSEMDLSYAGLVELLSCIDGEVVSALPAPQARVLRVILRREEPDGAFDRLSLGVATMAAIRQIAATHPVLITIDDSQWLDHPTAKTMAFVVRRLAGVGVRVAVVRSLGGWSARSSSADQIVDWRAELARAMPDGRVDSVRLGPIGPRELSRILRRVLGWVPAWPQVARIAELSAGNPMYALELARAFGTGWTGKDPEGSLPSDLLELARLRVTKLPTRVRRTRPPDRVAGRIDG